MPRARSREDICPICEAPSAATYHPFCGQGCRDRDLIRWLSDGYALPIDEAAREDEEA